MPIFNEALVIPELLKRLEALVASLSFATDVIFVNDGSSDDSLALLAAYCRDRPNRKLISFSRNFGHQFAITAGVDYASGAAVVVMDADLQDPPEIVRAMYEKHKEGFDVVYAVRKRRLSESFFKRVTAAAFYRILRAMVGVPIPLDAGDFRLMGRNVVLTLRSLRETNRFVRGMVAWVGFKQTALHYERAGRFAGETHYTLRKMVRLAIDAMTSFSTIPLRISSWLGVFGAMVSLGIVVWALLTDFFGHVVPGWTTVVATVAGASSVQLIMIGVLGEYVGRIYEEIKQRPLYIVEREINCARELTSTLADSTFAPVASSVPKAGESPTGAR